MNESIAAQPIEIDARAEDGHRWTLLARIPANPQASLLWLPALGVASKHYLPFAEALAARGVAVFLHEWRGGGSSNLRAGRDSDWGYRELLCGDIPTSEALVAQHAPDVPRIIGGHSLGGQLACCRLGLSPATAQKLWLVASGAPYWRAFPLRTKWFLPFVYRFLAWLADRNGALPGRRIGFGGQEARGLIRDWSLTGLSGRYAARWLDFDLDALMGAVEVDVHGVVMDSDWLGPESSLRFLLSKLRHSPAQVDVLDATTLGAPADHYAWMKQPRVVVEKLLG
ncbi:alpha/beta hydrolase [Lysobacter sp. TAF61]|uniref:alpha/beta hydrolase family protein n=1 Tax=Lysobacter sp. TAF61 TaxID=3233072 RepID=UPI003F9C9B68